MVVIYMKPTNHKTGLRAWTCAMCRSVSLFKLNRFCVCDLKTLPSKFQRGEVLWQQVWCLHWWRWRVRMAATSSEHMSRYRLTQIFVCPHITISTTGVGAKLMVVGGVVDTLWCTACLRLWRHRFLCQGRNSCVHHLTCVFVSAIVVRCVVSGWDCDMRRVRKVKIQRS
jgi:hypothetical protein